MEDSKEAIEMITEEEEKPHHAAVSAFVVNGDFPPCRAFECPCAGVFRCPAGSWWCYVHETSYAFMVLGARLGYPEFAWSASQTIDSGSYAWQEFAAMHAVTDPAPTLLWTLCRVILYEEATAATAREKVTPVATATDVNTDRLN